MASSTQIRVDKVILLINIEYVFMKMNFFL